MTGGDTRITHAETDWAGLAPRSVFFGDIYFSGDGLAETRHVFLDGNALPNRFAQHSRFRIGELGFGTGLNFLAALAAWRSVRPSGAQLDYFSVERHPLSQSDMERAHAAWPELQSDAAALRRRLPPPHPGFHRIAFAPGVSLTLAYGDARAMLEDAEGKADAWFLDGFAPSRNPDMWTWEIFAGIARLSRPGATFATYTAAGSVRRGLEAAGFSVARAPGFGRKKEMLTGVLRSRSPLRARRAPWHPDGRAGEEGRDLPPGASVGVIGGGIAGASLAHAARAAGLVPVLIDPQGLAAGASGNDAGLVMPRLDLGGGAAAGFFVAAHLYAVRMLTDFPEAFRAAGVLHLAADGAAPARQEKILAAGLLPDGWIEPRADGLFYPQAGIVDPRALVKALAEGAEIDARRAIRLYPGERPAVLFADGATRAFDAVVIANGADALAFAEARSLPLKTVLGQIDRFPRAPVPSHAIAFGPYAAPAPQGGVVIGATYETPRPRTPEDARAATLSNIEAVRAHLPEFAATLSPDEAISRASLRCQTPDRLPLAGPLPDWDFYGAAYDDLRFGRKRDYPEGARAPGVHILAGLGSRGFVTAPLCAAMIVAALIGDFAPLSAGAAEAVHPARFFIRDLKRARPAPAAQ